MSLPIPAEAYGPIVSMIGILVEQAIKWISAMSGKSVDEVRADIKKEIDSTQRDLAEDRAAEHERYNNS